MSNNFSIKRSKKKVWISFRVTEDELKEIDVVAEIHDVSRSDLMRLALFDFIEK